MGLTFLRVFGMNGASRDGSWTSQASPTEPSGLRRAKPSVWYCFGEIGEGTSRDG